MRGIHGNHARISKTSQTTTGGFSHSSVRILFDDLAQLSDAPRELKSAALAETMGGTVSMTFPREIGFDCVGIGNYGGEKLKIRIVSIFGGDGATADGGGPDTGEFTDPPFYGGLYNTADNEFASPADGGFFRTEELPEIEYRGSGLYMLDKVYTATSIDVELAPGAEIGRFALGMSAHIPTTPTKGLGYVSTAEDEFTEAGQVVHGEGGHAYRALTLDSRYKIGPETMAKIEEGYKTIGAGFPFFLDLKDEAHRLPFDKFYGTERNQKSWVFQGGVNKFLYSLKFDFEECF